MKDKKQLKKEAIKNLNKNTYVINLTSLSAEERDILLYRFGKRRHKIFNYKKGNYYPSFTSFIECNDYMQATILEVEDYIEINSLQFPYIDLRREGLSVSGILPATDKELITRAQKQAKEKMKREEKRRKFDKEAKQKEKLRAAKEISLNSNIASLIISSREDAQAAIDFLKSKHKL